MFTTSLEAIVYYLSLPAAQVFGGQLLFPYQLDGIPGFVSDVNSVYVESMPDCYNVGLRGYTSDYITVRCVSTRCAEYHGSFSPEDGFRPDWEGLSDPEITDRGIFSTNCMNSFNDLNIRGWVIVEVRHDASVAEWVTKRAAVRRRMK
jgi:hypothetical protein